MVPDGSKIAFLSERDGNSEIYVMDVDGTDAVRLTTSPAPDVSPAWSPDGNSIAFASQRDGNYEIYVMSADGSDQRRLTRNLDIDLDPAWSPNGRSIAFTSNRDGNYEIYVMSPDGSNQARLTANAAEDTTPDWQWQAVVPQPPEPVEAANFVAVRWKESTFSGSLRVSGRVPGLSKLQLALRRGKRVYLAAGLTLSKGAFSKHLALPRDLTPGAFTLEVTAVGSPTALTPQKLRCASRRRQKASSPRRGRARRSKGPRSSESLSTSPLVWAHFEFAALPRPGRRLATTWYVNGERPTGVDPKPRRSLVVAWLNRGGARFPHGTYMCVLTAGRAVVKRVTFRVS